MPRDLDIHVDLTQITKVTTAYQEAMLELFRRHPEIAQSMREIISDLEAEHGLPAVAFVKITRALDGETSAT